MSNGRSRILMKHLTTCQLSIALLIPIMSCGDKESEEILSALELQDVVGYWAIQGQDDEKNNYIHPVVRFRVVNTTSRNLEYVQVMAVFQREMLPDEPWGNAFSYSISEQPIKPGGVSDLLTMRSDRSVISKDSPEQMFRNAKWEEIMVEIFLRVGPSSWRILETFQIPKTIGAPGLEKFLEAEPDLPQGKISGS